VGNPRRAVARGEPVLKKQGPVTGLENSTMNLRQICAAAGIAAFMVAATANATVHRVFPGESIQAAIDVAAPGDTILVEPGTYKFVPPAMEAGKYYYGLRIKTDNLRLIGRVVPGRGEAGKVRLVYDAPVDPYNNVRAADVGAGVYAAPDVSLPGDPRSCDPDVSADSPLGQLCKANSLKDFYIRGFSVEGFPRNGIQTRWVEGFEFIRNESVNNLNNGIYPTLSANGLVQNNVSYGSLDTAMWVAGSENVRVIGNEVFGSVIGFEITVSNNVWVTQNRIYDNTVGIGLFHPNGAGNPPLPVMANWVVEHNDVRDNNRPNAAVPGTFQSALPSGIGILLTGVSDHVIAKNTVEDNDFVGIAVLGWCTANSGTANDCSVKPPITDPRANNNLVSQNKVSGNGASPPEDAPFPAVDLLYVQFALFEPGASGNCFEKNKPSGFTYFSSTELDFSNFPPPVPVPGPLPTDGCKKP
jgi:parallel beta-helix repeat protein